MTRAVTIGGGVVLGGGSRLVFIGGPCVIESETHAVDMAGRLREACSEYGVAYIFKASYDKAQRSSVRSYRGPGIARGLDILAAVKRQARVPVLSDVHCVTQVAAAAEVLDVLRIPAFLARQTDIIVACGRTGKPVEIKKGQYMAPEEMEAAAEKVRSTGNDRVILTERGTTFGYGNLVVDMRALPIMRRLGYPVVFDGSHPVQIPGGAKTHSAGRRDMVPYLARAAVAAGVDGLFLEVHDDPDRAPCDGAISITPDELRLLLAEVVAIDDVVKAGERRRARGADQDALTAARAGTRAGEHVTAG